MGLMKTVRDVGIVGYGAYVPRLRLPGSEVSRVWAGGGALLPIREKAVPELDEDVVTMAVEAARNAVSRAEISATKLGAVWIGSESNPYAVKPTSTVVAEILGVGPNVLAADWQFACKAGTEAMQGAVGLVGSGAVDYALIVGVDAAQSKPGDVLEYTAGAGGAAYVLGPARQALAVLEASLSYVSDTPDFWRRQHQHYPEHGGRFTGEPAYCKHVTRAAEQLMTALSARASDYDFAVFHQPNTKFPRRVASDLGFSQDQIRCGLVVDAIGNAYAGSALLGLSAVLDVAQPGQRILLVSFGSGAGSDAFSLRVTDRVRASELMVPKTRDYIARRSVIDYARYARHRRKYDA